MLLPEFIVVKRHFSVIIIIYLWTIPTVIIWVSS